jgi:histidinol-phosphate/aromatic aminotransferase/cobyric acid decarboxylase-like protein/choline kinase
MIGDVESISPIAKTSVARAKRAVILAAGVGRRLGIWSDRHPKALLPVCGIPLLERSLTCLRDHGVTHIVLVIGHLQEQLRAFVQNHFPDLKVDYVVSDRYATTNNSYSLWLARDYLTEDILLLEADLLYVPELIGRLQRNPEPNQVAISRFTRGMDGTVVRLDGAGNLSELIEGKEQGDDFDYSDAFKTVNIYRLSGDYLSREFVPALNDAIGAGRVNDYYELVFKTSLGKKQWEFHGLDCSDLFWSEIDDWIDWGNTEYAAKTPQQRLDMIHGEYGGLWRHGVRDHTYLYNPHFPPEQMWERLNRDFRHTVKQYPVGQAALAEITGHALDLDPTNLVIANGASEIIKIICGRLNRRIIVPVPTFDEYLHATPRGNLVEFPLSAPDFGLDVDAFADAAIRNKSEIAILVSPNNPTSLATGRDDIMRLMDKLSEAGILLVVDESFVEFSKELNASLTDRVAASKNLAILKSLSKVYGVGGIRLGYLYTSDDALSQAVRRELPIWNVNGIAEQFLRLLPRYHKDFVESCYKVKADRDQLAAQLSRVPGLLVYEPQANFVFVRLPYGLSAAAVTRELFEKHDLLVKDCSRKIDARHGQFLRIASLDTQDNERLVKAIGSVLAAACSDGDGDER